MQLQIRIIRMKLKSVLTFLGILSLSVSSSAQSTSVSPYSAVGVGTLFFGGSIEQSGMGGLSAVNSSPFNGSANFYNPAVNRDLRVTSFDLSASTDMKSLKDHTYSLKKSTTYISNLSLAFPIGPKIRAGFGFTPYSSSSYDLGLIGQNSDITYAKLFKGNGGVNSMHLMGAYTISPEFSAGLRVNYLFGDFNRTQTLIPQGLALNTDYTYKTNIHGFQFTLGGLYTKALTDNKRIDVGLTYTLGSELNATTEDLTTTYSLADLTPINIDTVQYKKIYGDVKLPQKISLAASYKKDLKWMVGAQLDWSDWSNYKLNGEKSSLYDTQIRTSVGGYWIPNFNSYKSYFDRIVYRFGAFYEKTPLKINDKSINMYGLSVGLGLPIGKDRDASMLNISCEFGSMGNTKNFAVKEDFANLRIGFTLNDLWFRKRVID